MQRISIRTIAIFRIAYFNSSVCPFSLAHCLTLTISPVVFVVVGIVEMLAKSRSHKQNEKEIFMQRECCWVYIGKCNRCILSIQFHVTTLPRPGILTFSFTSSPSEKCSLKNENDIFRWRIESILCQNHRNCFSSYNSLIFLLIIVRSFYRWHQLNQRRKNRNEWNNPQKKEKAKEKELNLFQF